MRLESRRPAAAGQFVAGIDAIDLDQIEADSTFSAGSVIKARFEGDVPVGLDVILPIESIIGRYTYIHSFTLDVRQVFFFIGTEKNMLHRMLSVS